MATGSTDKDDKKTIKKMANLLKDLRDKRCERSPAEVRKRAKENLKDEKTKQYFSAQDDAQKEMEDVLKEAYFKKMFGITETRTDDGDQSPVSGEEAIKLKYMWACGMDWNPTSPLASKWMKILAAGDYDAMLCYIKNKTGKEIHQLLELRETKLNFSALFHIVKGAMTNNTTPYPADLAHLYVECLCKLIDLGASIHARDFAGFTLLHYCVTMYASPTSLKLARILLKCGADPNAVNRLGCTALLESVMGMRVDCVKLLLEHGADPTIRDNDGCSVESMYQAQHKTMKPLFVEARKRKSIQMREEAKKEFGGNLRMCQICGESTGTSRCAGCFITRYCGPECQKIDWENHKDACKEIQRQYVPVKLTKLDNLVIRSGRTGKVKVMNKNQEAAKQNFVVKIQIPFDDTVAKIRFSSDTPDDTLEKTQPYDFFSNDDKKASLVLYDEKKTVTGKIEEDEPSYPNLVEKIRAEGVFGDKGFFYAIFDKNKNLKINTSKILPPEVW